MAVHELPVYVNVSLLSNISIRDITRSINLLSRGRFISKVHTACISFLGYRYVSNIFPHQAINGNPKKYPKSLYDVSLVSVKNRKLNMSTL